MKNKFLALLVILFLTAGCDVTYNLDIDGSFVETTSITEDITNMNEDYNNINTASLFNIYLQKPIPLSKNDIIQAYSDEKLKGVLYYEKKDISTDAQKGMELKGNFSPIDFENSQLINFTYGTFSVENKDGIITLTTGNTAKIFNQFSSLNNLTINITTDYKVLNSNADIVDGNTYTWNVNSTNYENKPISIKLDTSEDNSIFNNFQIQLALILLTIILVALIIYFFVKKKGDKNNSI